MAKDFNDARTALLTAFERTRQATEALSDPLSAEDQCVQTMPDVSPTKWHRAHTTWFWETFLLGPNRPDYRVFDEGFCYLFNSYYEQVGERHPRPERGFLTRPTCAEIGDYRRHVDQAVADFLSSANDQEIAKTIGIVQLGIAHEQQHQELLVTDIKHVLSRHPFGPAAYPAPEAGPAELAETSFADFEGGLFETGYDGAEFAFDNEGPRHKIWLEPFGLADHPVTNREYAEFIADGGYDTATLWLSDGWSRIQEDGRRAPLYWRERDGEWFEFTLHGEHRLDPDAPVSHLDFYEANAFAEWTGFRLPTESEWEHAAARAGKPGRFLKPGISAHPAGVDGEGLRQMYGGVWEWTRSDYAPYPGFRAPEGAVGEYNGKFMCGQYVLRGGSCATPDGHVRRTYRNFFPPNARWQFSGLRLARDV